MTPRHPTLKAGMVVPFGGDRFTEVTAELAEAFGPGDKLVVVQETGDLLRIPVADAAVATQAVDAAVAAFRGLGEVTDSQIERFYEAFAERLLDGGLCS